MKGDPVIVHMPATIRYEGRDFAAVQLEDGHIHMIPDQYIQRTEAKQRD